MPCKRKGDALSNRKHLYSLVYVVGSLVLLLDSIFHPVVVLSPSRILGALLCFIQAVLIKNITDAALG